MKLDKPEILRWAAVALMVGTLGACGGGGGGTPSAPATTGSTATPSAAASAVVEPTAEATSLAASVSGESCAMCHAGDAPIARSGPGHQAAYDKLYQDGVIKVTGLTFAQTTTTAAGDTSTLTFKMTKSGSAFDCTTADTIGSYWAAYDPATNTFPSDLSLGGTTTYNATTGVCTMTKTFTAAADIATLTAIAGGADGEITLYGADGVLETVGHMQKAEYPFAAIRRFGATMGAATAPYVSRANVSGCENCHTQPFNKHAYIPGTVDDNTPGSASTTQQFYVCKGCHYDKRDGHDQFWQLLKEAKDADATTDAGKALRDRAVAVNGGDALTAEETTKYAYKARLMNDVHMSHSMEFAYPQSMRNCVTCHAGKMDETTGIFKPANFTAETCISCHTVNGIEAKMKAASFNHSSIITDVATLRSTNCTSCHGQSFAPSFKTIHTGGYDPKIYTADGVRYSTTFKVSIDSATFADNVLDVKFSATGSVGSYKASDIIPTILIGLYGYDTKDFIVAAHGTDSDGNRNLEHLWGDGNPRFTDVSASNGAWEVKVDLSLWKDMIGSGEPVKRAEIAILPKLGSTTMTEIEHGSTTPVPAALGLDAPSRTFDLVNNKFDDAFYTDIVNVHRTSVTTSTGYKATKGCNTCHDQLATTFHTGIRGGNIRVCRICHEKSNPASHLEIQSRSIDSYVHAIHSFQEFNGTDFSDPFQAMLYSLHTEEMFPRFGLGDGATDCESCHVNGKYGVPDQSKSLPAVLSASATLTGKTNPIGTWPSYVTGPAATACGGCHRAHKIVEEDAGGLKTLWDHWTQNGYLIENVDTLWNAVVAKVMAPFK